MRRAGFFFFSEAPPFLFPPGEPCNLPRSSVPLFPLQRAFAFPGSVATARRCPAQWCEPFQAGLTASERFVSPPLVYCSGPHCPPGCGGSLQGSGSHFYIFSKISFRVRCFYLHKVRGCGLGVKDRCALHVNQSFGALQDGLILDSVSYAPPPFRSLKSSAHGRIFTERF